MLVISSREFRDKQREYLDRVDKGEQLIVQRGKDKAYAVTPVEEDDWFLTAEERKRLEKSVQQADNGETITVKKEDIGKFLDEL